jgi:hypothetical protein
MCHSVTHVMGVTFVMCVTLVTNILSCVIGHQMCHKRPIRNQFQKSPGGVGGCMGRQKVVPRPLATTSLSDKSKKQNNQLFHLLTTGHYGPGRAGRLRGNQGDVHDLPGEKSRCLYCAFVRWRNFVTPEVFIVIEHGRCSEYVT